MKKLLSILLTLAMVLSLAFAMVILAGAAGGTTYYVSCDGSNSAEGTTEETPLLTIKKALKMASEGDTIMLLSDVTENVTIGDGKVITLDLNGYTLSAQGYTVQLSKSGCLTVQDSSVSAMGKISASPTDEKSAIAVYLLNSTGTFILKSSTVSASTSNEQNAYAICSTGSGAIKIEGGKVESSSSGTGDAYGIRNKGSDAVNITGGTVSVSASGDANAYGIGNLASGEIIMSGGEVTAEANGSKVVYGIYNSGVGNVTLSGGSVTAKGNGTGKVCGVRNSKNGIVTVSGASVSAEAGSTANNSCALYSCGSGDKAGKVIVSSGSVSVTSESAAECFAMYMVGSGTTIVEGGDITATATNNDSNAKAHAIRLDESNQLTMSGGNVVSSSAAASSCGICNLGIGDASITDGYVKADTTITSQRNVLYASGACEITITGGSFDGFLRTNDGTYKISGGKFTDDPTAFLTEYYCAIPVTGQEPYKYNISDDPVANDGSHGYPTVQDAVKAAKANTNTDIYLMKDVTMTDDKTNVSVAANKIITLHLDGHTLSANSRSVITNKGNLTIYGIDEHDKVGEIKNTGKNGIGITNSEGGILSIYSGKVTESKIGIKHNGASLTLAEKANITGNTTDLYLKEGKYATVSNPAWSGKIAVGISVVPTDEEPANITGENSADYSSYFTSKDATLVMRNSTGNVLQLFPAAVVETVNASGVKVGEFASVKSAIPSASANGYTIRLIKDITENVTIDSGKTVTLDLNGKVLKGDGTTSVITNNGTLKVIDGAPAAKHYFTYKKNAAWVLKDDASSEAKTAATALADITSSTEEDTLIEVVGGCITGGNATYGGAIRNKASLNITGGNLVGNKASVDGGAVRNGGTFQMSGGAILGCSANNGGAVLNESTATSFTLKDGAVIAHCHAILNGGAVYNNSMFSMEGGKIAECTAKNGGGVFVSQTDTKQGKFTMSAGSIENCEADNNGGGVVNFSGTSTEYGFIMTGGAISGCKAKYGGGVFANGNKDKPSTNYYTNYTMLAGGTIKNNECTSRGGGVYFGPLTESTLSGNIEIKNNKGNAGKYGAVSNLMTLKAVTLGTLGTSADVGIALFDGDAVALCTGAITTNGAAADASKFTPDNLNYKVKFVAATTGESAVPAHLELAKYTVTKLTAITNGITLEKSNMTAEQAKAIAQDSFTTPANQTKVFYKTTGTSPVQYGYVYYNTSGSAWKEASSLYTFDELIKTVGKYPTLGFYVIGSITEKDSVTITATVNDVNWTGNAVTKPTYTVMFGNQDVTDSVYQNLEFAYYDMANESEKLDAAPSAVGYYKLVISVKDSDTQYYGSATYTFEIKPVINQVDDEIGITTATDYVKSEQTDLTIHSSAELKDFIKLTVTHNGTTTDVPENCYHTQPGSIEVTLHEAYLDTLEVGTYVFHIISGINTAESGEPVWLQKEAQRLEFSADITVTVSDGCKYAVCFGEGENVMLLLGGKEAGKYTITKVSGGYTIYDGTQYIALSSDGTAIVKQSNAYIWKYDGGLYGEVKTTKTTKFLFWSWNTTKTTKVYLGQGTDALILSSKLVSAQLQATGSHEWAYKDNHDGATHKVYCAHCNKVLSESTAHEYNADTHLCVCGKFDPAQCYVTGGHVYASTKKLTTGFWFWKKTKTVYHYDICMEAQNTGIAKVEYSGDGEHWDSGCAFNSDVELEGFYIRVTDCEGDVTNWLWDGEKVTQIGGGYTITLTGADTEDEDMPETMTANESADISFTVLGASSSYTSITFYNEDRSELIWTMVDGNDLVGTGYDEGDITVSDATWDRATGLVTFTLSNVTCNLEIYISSDC